MILINFDDEGRAVAEQLRMAAAHGPERLRDLIRRLAYSSVTETEYREVLDALDQRTAQTPAGFGTARAESGRAPADPDPVATLDELGAVWSPDLDRYAAGEIEVHRIRCALCRQAPCACPPFGSAEYLALLDELHGRRR